MLIWFGRPKEDLAKEVMFDLSLSDKWGRSCAHLGEMGCPRQRLQQYKGSKPGKKASSRFREEAELLAMSEQRGECRR